MAHFFETANVATRTAAVLDSHILERRVSVFPRETCPPVIDQLQLHVNCMYIYSSRQIQNKKILLISVSDAELNTTLSKLAIILHCTLEQHELVRSSRC
jgi:hypothetical protein